jgi:hypothetical protein
MIQYKFVLIRGRKVKKKLLAGIAIGLFFSEICMVETAGAIIISENLSASGDELLTYDSATGLSWLDVSLTVNKSYNDIMSGYGAYTTTLGFRYATENEVAQLFSDAGVTSGNILGYWNFSNQYYTATFNLVSLLGITYPFDGLTTGTIGLTGSSILVAPSGHDLAYLAYNNHADSGVFVPWTSLDDSDHLPWVGSFLVRTSIPKPVPEPTTILLFGTGIVGLAGNKIRRKQKIS